MKIIDNQGILVLFSDGVDMTTLQFLLQVPDRDLQGVDGSICSLLEPHSLIFAFSHFIVQIVDLLLETALVMHQVGYFRCCVSCEFKNLVLFIAKRGS